MNRRRFLAALATGGVAATAGCGYAHGGGDVRETRSFASGVGSTGGFGRTARYLTADDRIVRAITGDTAISFREPTQIDVFDRAGDSVWETDHHTVTVALATGRDAETVYLIEDPEEGGDLVAFAGPEAAGEADEHEDEEDPFTTDSTPEGSLIWRASVDGLAERVATDEDPPPAAGDDRGAYLVFSGEVVAVRDGETAWRRSIGDADGRISTIHAGFAAAADGPAVVLVGDDEVVALATDGDVRWRHAADATVDGDSPLAVEVPPLDAVPTPRVHVRDGERLFALDPADGTERWEAPVVDGHDPPHTVNGIVAVPGRSGGDAIDAANGDPLWTTDRRVSSPFVADDRRGYSVTGDAVTAVDADGLVWRRVLEDARGPVIDGWIEADRVAFTFDDGRIVTLQRYDEETALLPLKT